MNGTDRQLHRFARTTTVGIVVCLAVLSGPAGGLPGEPAAGWAATPPHQASSETGASPYRWKDPDGNPLPFQSHGEIVDFLQHADIEEVESIELGVTNPRQVILERDGVRMHAALRDYEETFEGQRFDGEFFSRLRDSYIFDLPAYEMSLLLGLDNIPPVTLRRIGGDQVSLQAWVEGGLMETDRIADDLEPPSLVDFRRQTQDMRVFDTLIGNVDRNTGNVLYDQDWKFWLIDHSRSFGRNDDTRYLEDVNGVSRWLYVRIKALTVEELEPRLSPPLTDSEVEWILARRDKLVAHIEALIAEKGEGAVLFERGE